MRLGRHRLAVASNRTNEPSLRTGHQSGLAVSSDMVECAAGRAHRIEGVGLIDAGGEPASSVTADRSTYRLERGGLCFSSLGTVVRSDSNQNSF